MRVTLPEEATISTRHTGNPDIEISGGGRVAGVMLRMIAPGNDGRHLRILRLPADIYCVPPDLQSEASPELHGTCPLEPRLFVRTDAIEDVIAGEARLPAGDYRLYAITDGRPVSVSLRLHGLSGTIVLAPQTPARIQVAELEPASTKLGTGQIYWGGATRDLQGQGLAWSFQWTIKSAGLAEDSTTCGYEGGEPQIGAYMPGCPLASVNAGWTTTFVAPMRHMSIHDTSVYHVSGLWGQGGYIVSAAAVDAVGGIVLWVTY